MIIHVFNTLILVGHFQKCLFFDSIIVHVAFAETIPSLFLFDSLLYIYTINFYSMCIQTSFALFPPELLYTSIDLEE